MNIELSLNTERKNIVVNYIAASTGGAYAILVQFLESIASNIESKQFNWIVFVSRKELEKYNSENIHIVTINSKGWISRILWDISGLQRWVKRNRIKVYKICSLQNTGIPNVSAEQYVYFHQSLILAKHIKLKWFEYKMIIYRFIYSYGVKISINRNSKVVVQTKWMKEELVKQFKFNEDNIIITKPKLDFETNFETNFLDEYSYKLFYPAVPHASYKNHELIIRALSELRKMNPELYTKIEIQFTSDPNFNKVTRYYHDLSKKLSVDSNISWCGYLSSDEMHKTYLNSDVVLFPSKLESFGLPLIEAAYRKKCIFTLNNNFSHELLDEYNGVSYLYDDPLVWANHINDFYKRDFLENQINDKFVLSIDSEKDIAKLLMY